MSVSSRRRTSKWDVVVEQQDSVECTDQVDDAGDGSMLKSDCNSSKLGLPSEVTDDPTTMKDENSDISKLPELLQKENDNARLPPPHSPNSDFPESRDSDKDYSKYTSRQSFSDCTTRRGDDFSRSRDQGNRSPVRTFSGPSAGGYTRRQRSPASTDKRGWGRSHRSRSRSRSQSQSRSRSMSRSRSRSRSPLYEFRRGRQRSRSPSYNPRRGPERWTPRGRTGSGPAVICRDFAAGRCKRGSDCRFLHEDNGRRQSSRYPDSDMSDTRENRGERGRYSDFRDSRDNRPSTRCYDFIKGRCQRGSECRYAHHEASYDSRRGDETRERPRLHDRDDSERRHGSPRRKVNDVPCKFFASGNCRRGDTCPFSHQIGGSHDDKSRYGLNQGGRLEQSQHEVPENDIYRKRPQETSNLLAMTPVQNQYTANQPVQAQSFPLNKHVQQLVPPAPLNAQMQQAFFPLPHNNQSQLVVSQAPANFNIPMQNIPVLLPSQIGQNQQNYNMPQPSHNGQHQQNFNLSGQVQQDSLPLINGQNQLNLNLVGQSHQTLPPPQVMQNQYVAPPPSNPEIFRSNEQVMQTGTSDTLNSDTPITPKVVTSEQAAQITNLSASLARFFGSAGALNPHIANGLVTLPPSTQGSFIPQQAIPTSGIAELVNSGTKNLPPVFDQKDPAMKTEQTNADISVPLSVTAGASYGITLAQSVESEVKTVAGMEEAATEVVNETEAVHNKKEQTENIEADTEKDENKQCKDTKGVRLFKCALVEFVKDALKPSWKEGHLSKEAHKTIVKKVVEKVTSAMQPQSIPHTQEKIDTYMSHSKSKLTKLVQAYVDKYVKP